MSNPEPNGFPQGDSQGRVNWPFAAGQEPADPDTQPVDSQTQPAFPAPAAPPAQSVPQYSQQPAHAREYPLAEGTPLPAGAQFGQGYEPPAFAHPEQAAPQPAAAVPVEQLSASPISDPVPAEQAAPTTGAESVPAAVESTATTPPETVAASGEADNHSQKAVADIEKSLHQQALTPWWLDALMALSLAGVMVFNGFGMSLGLRIGALIVMVIALVLITWYQGDAQEKSNTFLTGTLLGAVCGFLAGLIVVAASLYLVSPIPAWYPWILWLVSGVLLYLTYRGFRDWVMRNLQKKSQK